jgi:hypothetical protein
MFPYSKLGWDGVSKNTERTETGRRLGQHLSEALRNVYDATCPACTSIREKLNISTVKYMPMIAQSANPNTTHWNVTMVSILSIFSRKCCSGFCYEKDTIVNATKNTVY